MNFKEIAMNLMYKEFINFFVLCGKTLTLTNNLMINSAFGICFK